MCKYNFLAWKSIEVNFTEVSAMLYKLLYILTTYEQKFKSNSILYVSQQTEQTRLSSLKFP